MKRFVVITSINPPTQAVVRFSKFPDWHTIVVGDRKTPADWHLAGVRYLSTQFQTTTDFQLAERLPWNHYCRKMIGYLEAMRSGADIIADSDDDNLPYGDWAFPPFHGDQDYLTTAAGRGFINMYSFFSDSKIWPRGFPLQLIQDPARQLEAHQLSPDKVRVGIWQALADGDPDVDAVYRLTANAPCYFKKRPPVVLASGTVSPFNSQNTAFSKELFLLLYLPSTVTFRFTDILRGLVAQPILWQHGYHLGFTAATVEQARNEHDYMVDFESEIPCYLHGPRVVELVGSALRPSAPLGDQLFNAYEALNRAGIVQKAELGTLTAWIKDVQNLSTISR